MKHDDEEIGNGREPIDESEPSVSELVVRVNEPDVYTPTLDLSGDPVARASQELLRQAATRPGLRRAIRTNEKNQLELAPLDETEAREELEREVAKYSQQQRAWVPWFWASLAVVLAAALVILLGDGK